MRKSKNITYEERQYLFDQGISFHGTWISHQEGWEWWACPVGEWQTYIAIRSTQRAAYNAAIRWIKAGKPKLPSHTHI